jgi:hypothetical protein
MLCWAVPGARRDSKVEACCRRQGSAHKKEEDATMSAILEDHQHGGEALQAAAYAEGGRPALARAAASGSAQIASVVLPFLERAKDQLRETDLRLDSGVRKFDVATGENWSVYFRVVNTKAHKASPYYIVDLSSRPPLIIMVDSLDVGSGVRRREVWDETVQSRRRRRTGLGEAPRARR